MYEGEGRAKLILTGGAMIEFNRENTYQADETWNGVVLKDEGGLGPNGKVSATR